MKAEQTRQVSRKTAKLENGLIPCPRCGGRAILGYFNPWDWIVHCSTCNTATYRNTTREQAVSAWNEGIIIKTAHVTKRPAGPYDEG